ncbi:MAG: AI-2E family transporter [Xanthobacteraceae bacterium]|nr:AI-2E family transporter [Xanthobacteraceae bacterium]
MSRTPRSPRIRPQPRDDVIQLAIRLGVLALLIYWSFVLVRPFIPILIWSVVLAAALYPLYDRLANLLRGRRAVAASLLTVLSLVILIGPATWIGFGLVESLRTLSEQLNSGTLTIPAPTETVKAWPVIGTRLYDAWALASTNLGAAVRNVAPQLKPLAGAVLGSAGSAGVGVIKFLASVVIAGFLFSPGPRLVEATRTMLLHVIPERSDEFVALAGATIRSVARGVIGIAMLQALLAGIGFKVVGVPGASLLTFLVLALGILQLGSAIVVLPIIVWCWTWMDTVSALLFTAYIIPVSLIDNLLKPMVMGHGLKTPTLVILIGVIGGTLAHGLIGLFVGPIVLAVAWELLAAWMRDESSEAVPRE